MTAPHRPTNRRWDHRVDRILHSQNLLERRHLYLGRSQVYGYPVYLDRNLLHLHAWIHGGSGSRKTSLSFATLITQLIAGESARRQAWLADQAPPAPRADRDERSSILVLDLKGDNSLMWNCYAEAKAAGVPFRLFTNVVGRTSHAFNPLGPAHLGSLVAPNQQCQTILQALSAEYGPGFGPAYFSAINEIVLLNYLLRFGTGGSFRRLRALLDNPERYPGAAADWRHARHLPALAGRLAGVYPLNLTPGDLPDRPGVLASEIRMPDLLRESQVVYFYLSTAVEKTTVTAVAKLALYCLFAAAADRQTAEDRADDRHVYVFIDEFQQVASANMELLLEQARSMGLSLVLAHQNVGQLTADRRSDLVNAVESCVGFEQAFKVSGVRELERIERLSGLKRDYLRSWNDEQETWAETVGPRLNANDLIEASAAPFVSLARFSEGSGLSQFSGYFQPLVGEYHVTEKEYRERQTAGWPDAVTVEAVTPPAARGRGRGGHDDD